MKKYFKCSIDKLSLHTEDFEIPIEKIKENFHIKQNIKKPEKDNPFYQEQLIINDLTGQKAFINFPNNVKIEIQNKHLYLTFNPNSIQEPYTVNFFTMEQDLIEPIVKHYIKPIIKDMGIKTNLETMEFSRIDIAKDINTSQPIQAYFPVFESLSFSRMKTKQKFTTTYEVGNKSKSLKIYDKIEDQIVKNKHEPVYIEEFQRFKEKYKNIIRGEMIYTGLKECRKSLPYNTLTDLYKDLKFKGLRRAYNNTLNKNFFKSELSDNQAIITNMQEKINTIEKMIETYTNKEIKDFFCSIGVQSYFRNLDLQYIFKIIKRESSTRLKAYRLQKMIEEYFLNNIKMTEKIPLKKLYDELKFKLSA